MSFTGTAPEGAGCGRCLGTGTLANFLVGSAIAQARALPSLPKLESSTAVPEFKLAYCLGIL